MRIYGRIADSEGKKVWVVIQTDSNGNNDLVFVVALCQCLKLNLGESPFYAWAGIPAQDSVLQQVAPDYYVYTTQQVYAPYFASLIITRDPSSITPVYTVNVLTHQGVKLSANVSVPT